MSNILNLGNTEFSSYVEYIIFYESLLKRIRINFFIQIWCTQLEICFLSLNLKIGIIVGKLATDGKLKNLVNSQVQRNYGRCTPGISGGIYDNIPTCPHSNILLYSLLIYALITRGRGRRGGGELVLKRLRMDDVYLHAYLWDIQKSSLKILGNK